MSGSEIDKGVAKNKLFLLELETKLGTPGPTNAQSTVIASPHVSYFHQCTYMFHETGRVRMKINWAASDGSVVANTVRNCNVLEL